MYLLSIDSDLKTHKSNVAGKGYYTAVQYLAPAKLSGFEMCASRSRGCTSGCLNMAGNPIYAKGKRKARIARTKLFVKDFAAYKRLLTKEMCAFDRRCARMGAIPTMRGNGTSDIMWELVFPEMFDLFPHWQFYDYSKHVARFADTWALPANYHLTFSRDETNETAALDILSRKKAPVAIVFEQWRTHALPSEYLGFPVVDADKDDLRFLNPSGVWCGLRAKGKARKDKTGFVVRGISS